MICSPWSATVGDFFSRVWFFSSQRLDTISCEWNDFKSKSWFLIVRHLAIFHSYWYVIDLFQNCVCILLFVTWLWSIHTHMMGRKRRILAKRVILASFSSEWRGQQAPELETTTVLGIKGMMSIMFSQTMTMRLSALSPEVMESGNLFPEPRR